MRLLEITVGWFWEHLKFFNFTYSIRYVQKHRVTQLDISRFKYRYVTLRIVR